MSEPARSRLSSTAASVSTCQVDIQFAAKSRRGAESTLRSALRLLAAESTGVTESSGKFSALVEFPVPSQAAEGTWQCLSRLAELCYSWTIRGPEFFADVVEVEGHASTSESRFRLPGVSFARFRVEFHG